MEPDVLRLIRSINSEFYQTFAGSFAETRRRLQPGVQQLLPSLLKSGKILDLGCGNGELAAILADLNYMGNYLGVDGSERMLSIAQSQSLATAQFAFVAVELGVDDLATTIQVEVDQAFKPPYDLQIAFASLHHIPGHDARAALLGDLRSLLTEDGHFFVSVWNFMDSERLRSRLLPWGTVGLSEGSVEPGDYLIDWRRDGQGIRYVHHFSELELSAIAEQAGYRVQETFYSDGETGKLGLYQLWTIG